MPSSGSSSDRSITWPRHPWAPRRSRWYSAVITAYAPGRCPPRRRRARTAAASAARPPARSGGRTRSSPRPACRTRAARAYGPVLAEAGDPQHHQPRVDLQQRRPGPRPHFSMHARPEVLDRSRPRRRPARAAAPAPPGVPRSSVIARLLRAITFHHRPWPSAVPAVRAGRVAVRVLDLEDVGADVAEQHRRDRRGVDGADVEHLDPVERAASPGRVGRSLQFVHPLTPSSPVA